MSRYFVRKNDKGRYEIVNRRHHSGGEWVEASFARKTDAQAWCESANSQEAK